MAYCIAIERPGLCTGCEACVQKCPTKAIYMIMNKEGFYFPQIDFNKCIKCGLCEKVCPECTNTKIDKNNLSDKCYAATHKNRKILKQSSSGGAFSALVSLTSKNCIIYGASFDDNISLRHVSITNDNGLDKLRGSKYVQSRIYNSFSDIEKHLKSDKQVLFSGTPCQVAGLKSYLGKDYVNLLTIEIICHGVGSPGVFADYLDMYEKRYNKKLKNFLFRNKKYFKGNWQDFLTSTIFANGKIRSTRFDSYTLGFLDDLYLRECCYSCSYAETKRVSDIVIGDFWGIEKEYPKLYSKNGVSIIIPITEKGAKLCKGLSSIMNVSLVPTKIAFKENSSLVHPKGKSVVREVFFNQYIEFGIENAFKEFIKAPGLLYRIYSYMPKNIKYAARLLKKKLAKNRR